MHCKQIGWFPEAFWKCKEEKEKTQKQHCDAGTSRRSRNYLGGYRKMYGQGMNNEVGATREIEQTRVFVFLFSKPLMIYRTMLVLISSMF